MTQNADKDQIVLSRLGRSSRLTALGTFVAFLLIISTLIYSYFQMQAIERRALEAQKLVERARKEKEDLEQQERSLKEKINKENEQLERIEAALKKTNTVLQTIDSSTIEKAVAKNIVSNPKAGAPPPRVYIQIVDEAQRQKAREFQSVLQQRGYVVPGIENVGRKGIKGPTTTEVRYDNRNPGDADKAAQIAAIIHDHYQIAALPRPLPGRLKLARGAFEVWFAKSFAMATKM
jgi:septal ring factor EnvC (AmiA/AmiB activator)